MTTLVDGLEASGKVRRVPDPTNRRVIRIEVTAEGREALRELRGARRSAAEEILAPLTDEQREILGGCWTRWWTACPGLSSAAEGLSLARSWRGGQAADEATGRGPHSVRLEWGARPVPGIRR